MKLLRIFPVLAILMSVTIISSAQKSKTETFQVSGNCGMCKSKIEKAAKEAGASFASWDADAKMLTVKFNSTSTNTAKIQQQIATVGYDNAGFKAKDEVYNKLHGCCKYDRSSSEEAKASCCALNGDVKDAKCKQAASGKDCCKDEAACCKDGSTCCAAHEGGDAQSKMDCCKDGKCSKEGHNGPDCCKKS